MTKSWEGSPFSHFSHLLEINTISSLYSEIISFHAAVITVKRARRVVYGLDICVRVYLVTTGHIDKAMSG
jgi:hypothetical protein